MEQDGPPSPEVVAAAYWAAWRGRADFTESWAWALLDDAVTNGDGDTSVPLLGAMWRSAQADSERRRVVECLQEVLQLAPHRTPTRVIREAQRDPGLAAALALVRLQDLPAKAQEAFAERR